MENPVTVIEHFSTLLSIMYRTPKQKVNKNSKDFNNISQLNLTGIYETLQPTAAE